MTDQVDIGLLRRILSYDAETGVLTWKERTEAEDARKGRRTTFNKQFAGKEAFTAKSGGYRVGRMFDVLYKAHRVAWAIHHAKWPDGSIDHINGDKSDNRIVNLRIVDASGNAKNSKMFSHNTSGYIGVGWYKAYGKWEAHIQNEKKRIFLGYFDSIDDAVAARKKAERDMGFHENHGRAA